MRCKRAVPRSSSQDRSRRRDCNVENIQEYLETRGQSRSRAEESSYILEKKAGRGIYILENILEYESARDPLYSQRYSRIWCQGQDALAFALRGQVPNPPGWACFHSLTRVPFFCLSWCTLISGCGRVGPRLEHLEHLESALMTAQDIKGAKGSARKAPASQTRYH